MKDMINLLSDSVINDLKRMIENRTNIYAIALVCNDGMDSFFLALADLDDLDYILSKNKVTDNEDSSYYKWSPNEWLSFSYKLENSKLKEFNKELCRSDFRENNDFDKYRKSMFEICISSLIDTKLKIETLKNIPIFISFTDISKLEEIQNYSAYRINSESIYKEFKDRFSELDWGENLGQHKPFE